MKSRSGAKLLASRGDTAPTGHLDCRDPIRPLTAVRVDRVIGDQETVRLGGVTLMAHLTPGHTKGCTTWSTTINDAGRSYRVVFYCSTTVAGNQLVNNTENPNIVADFEQTFAKLAAMPADIFLAPHGSFFNRDEKLEARRKGRKDAFVNSADLPAYVALSEKAFREELARQRAAAAPH